MSNYKFYQNLLCEYFPCHKHINKEEFNCMFCFCPLYMLGEECGGDFSLKNNIKDCSKCTLPHKNGGYEYVISLMPIILKRAMGN